ncbi:unnamed protein product [Ilex paraguariensis]|uniref:Uncharacterized protein n=1 Tax=Ilex paraguariensis TaxID=185542 RepID=A0ABC8SX26_9AQUA
MGACASVPKAMRGETGAAPPPEPQKEEEVTTEVTEVKPEGEVNVEEEEKAEGGDENKKENEKVAEEKVDENDKHHSLGSLLNENEAPKDSIVKDEKTSQTETVPTMPEKQEEPKPEALLVSDAVAPVTPEPDKTSTVVVPVVDVSKDEKKTEEKEHK